MGSKDKGNYSMGALISSEEKSATNLFRYVLHLLDMSYSSVVAKLGGLIIPCALVWIASSLYMIWRVSATAVSCCPRVEEVQHNKVKVA